MNVRKIPSCFNELSDIEYYPPFYGSCYFPFCQVEVYNESRNRNIFLFSDLNLYKELLYDVVSKVYCGQVIQNEAILLQNKLKIDTKLIR